MAQRRGFPDAIYRPAGPRLRHHRGRGSRAWRAGRSVCASQSQRSRDASGASPAVSFPRPATGWTCAAFWSPGRTPSRRGGPSAMRCRCSVNRRRSRLPRSSRMKPTGRRRCRGSAMSWRGCRGTASGIGAGARAARRRRDATGRIAADVGAGVVIAGAYGHSRLSEWILGGVTRRLVNPSNRCSLLSR